MRKLLFLVDDNSVYSNTIDFACFLAKLTNSKLTGIFPEYAILSPSPAAVGNDYPNHIPDFINACIERESAYAVHRDQSTSVDDLPTESRYADVSIINEQQLFPDHLKTEMPFQKMKEIVTGICNRSRFSNFIHPDTATLY